MIPSFVGDQSHLVTKLQDLLRSIHKTFSDLHRLFIILAPILLIHPGVIPKRDACTPKTNKL